MTELTQNPWQTGNFGRGRRSRLLFGWSYEDERVELAAFGDPGRVCVIAAAGETAAACSSAGHQVTAIEINPTQLDYCGARLSGAPTRSGTAERGMTTGRSALSVLAPGWRRDRLVRVLATSGPAKAEAYWRAHLDTPTFRLLLATLLRPSGVMARVLRPEFAAGMTELFDQTLRARIGAGLARHGMAGNRFAWRLLAGMEDPTWQLPPRAGQIKVVCADVVEHLAEVPAGHYSGISLSNVHDGAGPDLAVRLLAAARHAIAPGGAIVLRSFADHDDPGEVNHAGQDASLLWGSVKVLRQPVPEPRGQHGSDAPSTFAR